MCPADVLVVETGTQGFEPRLADAELTEGVMAASEYETGRHSFPEKEWPTRNFFWDSKVGFGHGGHEIVSNLSEISTPKEQSRVRSWNYQEAELCSMFPQSKLRAL